MAAEVLAGARRPAVVSFPLDLGRTAAIIPGPELAVGVLRAAARRGLGVAPSGWDDSHAAASAGLTTIAQSLRDQGARCAPIALGAPAAGEVEWSLVRRRSTAIEPPTRHS